MSHSISKGELFSIFTKEEKFKNPTGGVFKILSVKKNDRERKSCLFVIYDGEYNTKCLFKDAAFEKAFESNLEPGNVFRVLVASTAVLPQKKKCVLVVEDVEILEKNRLPPNQQTGIFLDSYLFEHPELSAVPEFRGAGFNAQPNKGAPQPPQINPTKPLQQHSVVSNNYQQQQHNNNINNHNHNNGSTSDSQKRPIFAIEQLSPYQNLWTIKARVSYKSDIRTWRNQRGEGKLFNVNFLDETGEIRATAFNDNAEKYFEILQEGKVYYVSKARVQPSKPQFSHLKHPYELQLDRDSVVEECMDDQGNVPQLHFDFVKLSSVENTEPNSVVDVMGIIQEITPVFQINSKAGKTYDRRDITIVDDSGYSISLGLWNNLAVDFNLPEGSVIVAKGVRVSDFNGKSLSMTPNGNIYSNPETPEAFALKGWYDSQGKSSTFHSLKQEFSRRDNIAERKTIRAAEEENLGASERGDYFNIKAAITYVRTDNFCYPGCSSPNCAKKVIETSDGSWRCEKCDATYPTPNYRYTLSISVLDETGQMWLTLFNEQAETLLGVSANKLMEIKENSDTEFNDIIQKVQMCEFDFRIRARQDTYNDVQKIRYSAATISRLNFKAEADYLAKELSKVNI
ncbi:replication factor A subunit protein RFA1 SCDLUD_001506 [Saccharomycodes ludwigii]|uniref:replication factor A subunit protein RFA1 n=1 Tax=Saccharomycodes ludwigii TaxID=36035 RepID=UPI001E899D4B|nr:hypothetical protein SCDLUD_001506 [Saccharomycodes ludwigii]KAH3901733.1 hypothetical protein SCDLUD_001506 [Saccharomycodes ludwigii]